MPTPAELRDFTPDETSILAADVLEGLRREPKELPCKYLYDEEGSHLFDAICETKDYYPTRTELAIMDDSVDEMAEALGSDCLVIEFGSGSGHKTKVLLEALDDPAAYVPIEISRDHLMATARRLAKQFPEIEILPVCADYTADYELPTPKHPVRRRAIYFPGSTIGNFDRPEAEDFLAHMTEVCGEGGAVLLGVDLLKDREILESAYDDSEGVTAAFNLNYLIRLNRDLDADFDLDAFRHRAIFNAEEERIEMHLESLEDQAVTIAGESFDFAAGETICTEHSNKYTFESFAELAHGAGLEVKKVWTDDHGLFSVQYLEVI